MKRLLACVSLVAVTTTAALSAPSPAVKATAKPSPPHLKAVPIRIAPADEYFGKLKLSVLGIRNTIKDVGANLDIDQNRWTQLASKAAFAEEAMHDWEKKYPDDTWLAKMVFGLERMYAKLDTSDGRQHTIAAMKWLVHDFPRSWYGKTGRKELALGKVGKPIEATATLTTASPSPSAEPIAGPSPLPSAAAGIGTANAPASGASDQSPVNGSAVSPLPIPLPSLSPSSLRN